MIEVKKVLFSSKEYDEVLEIRKRVFVEEQKVPLGLEISNEKDSIFYAGYFDGLCVATARYRVMGTIAKIERVATLPAFRGKGLAKKLMLGIQADLNNDEAIGILPILYSQKSAVSFYLKLGWAIYGEPFTEAGISHSKMTFLTKDKKYKLDNFEDPELRVFLNHYNLQCSL